MVTRKNIKTVVSSIFSGYSFRKRVTPEPGGDLRVIQMKDLSNRYSTIKTDTLTTVVSRKINPNSFLQPGDVLFIAKGAHNFAIVFELNLPKAIASSAFFVLRPDPEKIVPGYLAWYLNQSTVQQFFLNNASGSHMPNVAKTTLERVTVIMPSEDIQRKIVSIDKLVKKEELLLRKIMQKKQRVVTQALMKIVETK
jgi:restriction endonuclease S subunit